MFGSEILNVAIGLILVYLLLSLICSAIREGLEGIFKTRASALERGIRQLLHDSQGCGLAKNFYEHPLINSLYQGCYSQTNDQKKPNRNLPSYIPARNFALALLDIVARGKEVDNKLNAGPTAPIISLEVIRNSIHTLENPEVQRVILVALDTANGDLALARANIEDWYNSAMDRISGWYKWKTQYILFVIGLLTSVLLNINSIRIASALYQDNALREAVVAQAQSISRDTTLGEGGILPLYSALDALRLPIGWGDGLLGRQQEEVQEGFMSNLWYYGFVPLFGWLITAFAITLGAPFWFDVLNKFMVVRSTVKPHEKSPEEKSKDRQKLHTPSRQKKSKELAAGNATSSKHT